MNQLSFPQKHFSHNLFNACQNWLTQHEPLATISTKKAILPEKEPENGSDKCITKSLMRAALSAKELSPTKCRSLC